MATITGSGAQEFIHVANDGRISPNGYVDTPQATNDADSITPGAGDDIVYAGGGIDTVFLQGGLKDYAITLIDGGRVIDIFGRGPGASGRDELHDVERIVFSNGDILDLSTAVLRITLTGADDYVGLRSAQGAILIEFSPDETAGFIVTTSSRAIDLKTGAGADTVKFFGNLVEGGLSAQWITYQDGVGEGSSLKITPPLTIDTGDGNDTIDTTNARFFGPSGTGDPLQTWTTKITLGAGNDTYLGTQFDNVIISDGRTTAQPPSTDQFAGSGRGVWLDFSELPRTAGQQGVSVNLATRAFFSGVAGHNVTFGGVSNVIGTRGADSFTGNGFANIFNFVSGEDLAAGGGQEAGRYDLGATTGPVIVDLQSGRAVDPGPGPGVVFTSIDFSGFEGWIGSAFRDVLRGDAGANLFYGGGGDDEIDGRDGVDIALFGGPFSNYIVSLAASAVTVNDTRTPSQLPPLQVSGGIDTLRNIEILGFSDGLRAAVSDTATAFHVNAADWANGLLPRGVIGSSAYDSLRLELGLQIEGEGLSLTFSAEAGGRFELSGTSTAPYTVSASGLDEMDIYAPTVGSLRLSGDLGGIGPLLNPLEIYGGEISNTFDASGLTGHQRVVLDGGDGADVLSGGGGNDLLIGGAGEDRANFAAGRNSYSVTAAGGGWSVSDLRIGTPGGSDTLSGIELARFSDVTVILGPVSNTTRAEVAVANILRVDPKAAANQAFVSGLVADLQGSMSTAQVIDKVVQRADGTTAVAAMVYQFFLGFAPSGGGFDFLVSPTGPNPNNINSPYYQFFNQENRYINFAVNVAAGDGRAAFQAEFGALTLREATRQAYAEIFGNTPGEAKLDALLDGSIGGGLTRKDYLAVYGGDGLAGLGTKAAMVGFLLSAAAIENQGFFARSTAAYFADLADGAGFQVDMIGTYNQLEWAFGG